MRRSLARIVAIVLVLCAAGAGAQERELAQIEEQIAAEQKPDIIDGISHHYQPREAEAERKAVPLLRVDAARTKYVRMHQAAGQKFNPAALLADRAARSAADQAVYVQLEARLDEQRFLVGDRLTEADWRLFTTLVRFDAVYYGHFKCNLKRIVDYPNLSGYLRDLYQMPGIKDTVSFDHIKRHYYGSHASINPTGIVPLGPIQILDSPHRRDRLPAEGLPE